MKNKIFFVVLLAVFVAVGLFFASKRSSNSTSAGDSEKKLITTVAYTCDAGHAGITAKYYEGKAVAQPKPGEPPIPTGSIELTFTDGRAMTLMQTLSADGARYSNDDESFVFWSKGNGAMVQEKPEIHYNCSEKK